MINKKKIGVALSGAAAAAVMVLGCVGTAQAAASMVVNANKGKTVTFASEVFGTGTKITQISGPASINYSPAFERKAGSASFSMTFTLSSGTFSGTPTMDVTSSNAVSTFAAAYRSGGDGANTVTFDITFPSAGNWSTTLKDGVVLKPATGKTKLEFNTGGGLTAVGSSISITATQKDSLGTLGVSTSAKLFDSASGVTLGSTKNGSVGNIDVAQAAKYFNTTASAPVDSTHDFIGTVSTSFLRSNEANGALFDTTNDTFDLTISGDFTAMVATDADKSTATKDGVYLEVDGTTGFSASGGDIPATTLTATTATFTGVSKGTDIDSAKIMLAPDTATAIAPSTFTGSITWHDSSAGTKASGTLTLASLAKNGVSRTVLGIPSSTSGDKSFIRIVNTSGQAGIVRGTLYDTTGKVLLNNVQLVASLAPNAEFILGAGALKGAATALETLGAATWTNRARLVIDAEISSMRVVHTMRSPTGTLINFSAESSK